MGLSKSQSLTLVSVLLQVTCNGILYINAATVAEAPLSQNVSRGQLVSFTCATTNSQEFISWSTMKNINNKTIQSIPGDGKVLSVLSFTALLEHDNTIVSCIVTDPNTAASTISNALLLVQGLLSPVGNLTSTEVDHCTLRLNWTAPYTLQGVPIDYYTINITRHSDGTVLRTDTTNTTEYLYSVSSLREMVKAEVAAVNDAGTGNNTSFITQTPSSISGMKFMSSLMNTTRNVQSTKWTYTLHFEETSVCINAINHTIFQACMSSSCTNGTMSMLPDGERRVMATFTDLMENRKYTATLNIHYNGGVVQQSQPLENLSTFDVRSASYTVEYGRVCFDVTYVEGHAKPARSYSLFQSSTSVHNGMIDQTDKCIEVAPYPSYTIKITDEDAKDEIDSVAPVTLLGVDVPEHVSSTQNALSSNTVSTSLPSSDTSTIVIVSVVVPVIVGLVIAVLATISVVLCPYFYCKRHVGNKIKQIETDCHSLSEGHQAIHQLELNDQRTTEIIYADVGNHSNDTPNPALPVGEVQYGEILMSTGQQECLKRLAKMTTQYITLYELLQPLSLLWRQLGEALLLAPYLHDIQTKNFSDEERLQAVLKCWEDKHVDKQVRPYTLETLVTVLSSRDIRATHLATELRKRLTTNSVLLYN